VTRQGLSDADITAAQQGDADALGRVYTELAPKILGYLRAHRVPDPEAVTQDVFLGLLQRIPVVVGGAEGVRRLAFTIARARMIDAARASARAPKPVPYDPDLEVRVVPSAADDAEAALSLERVQAVLATLPAAQREVLTLRIVADLSIEQVAEILGRSAGAVKQLQRRALLTLRHTMGTRIP
jgi:RNA polymerase sigma-70 factor (ECF subfamily)